MTAVLAGIFGLENLQTIEDVVQDTFIAAHQSWRYGRLPENPPAWLMQTAKNKAINLLRREKKMRFPEETPEESAPPGFEHLFLEHEIRDSSLRLLFALCHPDFPERSRLLLTLKYFCGFGNEEIGNALLMQPEAVKKALLRLRAEIRDKRIPFRVPFITRSLERLRTVNRVLYLMFNEGYKTTRQEEDINHELCFESVRLAQLLEDIAGNPEGTAETCALLALMHFSIARFPARTNEQGEIVLLVEQDRSRWDRRFVAQGYRYLERSREAKQVSRYHLEAGIAALHCSAPDLPSTDWAKIVFYYERLAAIDPSPAVLISRALALGYLEGPAKGIDALLLQESDEAFERNFLYHAALGDLYARNGNADKAAPHYRRAQTLTRSQRCKHLLEQKLARLDQVKPV